MMHSDQIPGRNPSPKDDRNDPKKQDDSAQQPGTNTMSSHKDDGDNHQLTRTGTGEDPEFGKNADTAFDEVDEDI